MKLGALVFCAAALAAPAVQAQGLWWVEGDRFCGGFNNRNNNSFMCGNPKRGEAEPRPTFRYDFNFPRVPVVDDAPERTKTPGSPAPGMRAAPATRQQ